MITLNSLVKVAPFDEKTRGDILSKIEKNELDESQKLQMTSLCWDMITMLYETQLQIIYDAMLLEETEGKKTYSQNDFIEQRLKLMNEIAVQFEAVSKEEAITEVKKQLAEHTKKSIPTTA